MRSILPWFKCQNKNNTVKEDEIESVKEDEIESVKEDETEKTVCFSCNKPFEGLCTECMKKNSCSHCNMFFETFGDLGKGPMCTECKTLNCCNGCTRNVHLKSLGEIKPRMMCVPCSMKEFKKPLKQSPPKCEYCLWPDPMGTECSECHTQRCCNDCIKNVKFASRGESKRRPVCMFCIQTHKETMKNIKTLIL